MNDLEKLKKKLRPIAKVSDWSDENYAFCSAFARVFTAEMPNYDLGNGIYGATRSNWTYQTAFAIAQTAKAFGWICRFECSGKRDAVIETNDDPPVTRLFAEWEWDYKDIFGPGKELEKLKSSCRTIKTAEAFLLVYCPENEFTDYIYRIVEYWQKSFSRNKVPPALFINTITFRPLSGAREFVSLNSTMIHHTEVLILSDIPL